MDIEVARRIINDNDIIDLIFKLDDYSLKDNVCWNRSQELGKLRMELHKHLNLLLKNSQSDLINFIKHFS
jgi:hypothetical protein